LPNCVSICDRASSTALARSSFARSSATAMAITPLVDCSPGAAFILSGKHAAASIDSMGL
jgi:hypothetical protein